VHIAWHVLQECHDHADRKKCPTVIIVYDPPFNEYSIPDRSARSVASTTIRFCPWCGAKLPPSLRDRWFDELEKLGFDDPAGKDRKRLPAEFRGAAWWRGSRSDRGYQQRGGR